MTAMLAACTSGDDKAGGTSQLSQTTVPSTAPVSSDENRSPGPSSFAEVATHPHAARQPNARGRRLHVLKAHQGKVYAGYGDYGDNTGPITIASYDPARGRFDDEHTQDTDAIEQYRDVRGDLWSPAIDTKVNNDYAVRRAGSWAEVNFSDEAKHVFDVASFGSTVFLSGSSTGDGDSNLGVVWKSTDGGRAWSRDHTSDDPSQYYRCYSMAAFGEKVYVDCGPLASQESNHPDHFVYDGGSWSTTDLDLGHSSSQQFGDVLVTIRNEQVVSFDGVTVSDLGQRATVLAQEDGFLFAKSGSDIYRTTELGGAWTLVASYGGTDAMSFTVLDGYAYVGTANSKLYKSEFRVR